MAVIKGKFGNGGGSNEDEDSPLTSQEIIEFFNEQFAEGAGDIFILVENQDGETVTMSNLPLPQQLLWLDVVKLSFISASATPI